MNNMEISSIIIVLLPTLILMYINFKKYFQSTNPFMVFAECLLAFGLFFIGFWFIFDSFFGEQISWAIYILSILSLSLYTIALFLRCIKLQLTWTKKNWFWLLFIVILIEMFCVKFLYILYI